MRKVIDFGQTVYARGRNGGMLQRGLEVMTGDTLQANTVKVVRFQPMNTQGVGNGMIEVPVANLGELIQLLQQCQSES